MLEYDKMKLMAKAPDVLVLGILDEMDLLLRHLDNLGTITAGDINLMARQLFLKLETCYFELDNCISQTCKKED